MHRIIREDLYYSPGDHNHSLGTTHTSRPHNNTAVQLSTAITNYQLSGVGGETGKQDECFSIMGLCHLSDRVAISQIQKSNQVPQVAKIVNNNT